MDGLKRCKGKEDKIQKPPPGFKKQNKNPKLSEGLNGCWLHNENQNKTIIETEPNMEQTDTDIQMGH